MTINIGINGMGRIGRMVIRAIIESQNKNIKIKHINNRSNSEASCTLIKYDSVHGKFNADLDYDENHLIINKNKITFSQESKIEVLIGKNLVLIMFLNVLENLTQKKNYFHILKMVQKKLLFLLPVKMQIKLLFLVLTKMSLQKMIK